MIDALAHQLSMAAPGGIEVVRGAAILDGPYPKSFDDFIGQDLARRMLLTAVESAHKRDAVLGHVLLASGVPGLGKTTLGRLTAALLDTGFVELGDKVTASDAIKALRAMEDGDVLFLDEFHRLVAGGRNKADWLLTLMQDGKVQTATGVFHAPKITIIAATTDAEKLQSTILGRFHHRPLLVEYSTPEAVRIADGIARRLGFGASDLPLAESDSWLHAVAKAGQKNPRAMTELLINVRDVAVCSDLANFDSVTGYDITESLAGMGLTADGLTMSAQTYLLALYSHGGSAGAATVKAILGETSLDHTEKALLTRGFIDVGTKGRSLTEYGLIRARELAEQTVATHVAREEAVA